MGMQAWAVGGTVGDGIVRVLPAGTMEGVDHETHVAAAVAAGFDAVSLRPALARAWAAERGEAVTALGQLVADAGLAVAELDPLLGWHGGAAAAGSEAVAADLDLAVAVGARAVSALVPPGAAWDPDPGVEGLAELCRRAEERGLLVQVEPFGWSALGELGPAAEAVRACGATNAGLMVDTWHLARRGGTVADVDRLAVGEVLGVQVADGARRPEDDDLAADNRANRRWPGEGELAPDVVVASLLRRGWAGPVAVEVFGDASTDPHGRARRAAAALDLVLARAAARAGG